jgi:putative ABC transport system permease protein
MMLLALLFVASCAGLYPAFILSSFRPVSTLRGKHAKHGATQWIQTALVTFQFAASIALGICAVVVQSQSYYAQTKDLGFSTQDKVVLRWMNWGHFKEKSNVINDRIKAHPDVIGTAYSNAIPGDDYGNWGALHVPGYTTDEGVRFRAMNTDDGFFELYNVKLLAGRYLSSELSSDSFSDEDDKKLLVARIILNESAIGDIGFESANHALGVEIDLDSSGLKGQVVGVVKDFHFDSLKDEIPATAFYMDPNGFGNLTVRFREGTNVPELVHDITAIWQDFIPRDPITLEFLDQNIMTQYEGDRRKGVIVTVLAALALIIACMGLYGLSTLTRQREPGKSQ